MNEPRNRTAVIIRVHWEDILYVLGCVLVTVGVWQVLPPAGLIAAGCSVLGYLAIALRAATGSADGIATTGQPASQPGKPKPATE